MILNNSLEALSEEYCKIAEKKSLTERGKELYHRAKETVTDKENLRKATPYAAGGLAALATYGLMRKFKQHKNPALAALQKEMKDKKLIYQVDGRTKKDRLIYGTKTINSHDAKIPKNRGVINASSASETAKGDVRINTELANDMNDKIMFDQVMNYGWEGSKAPSHGLKITAKDTRPLSAALKKVNGNIDDLNKLYPDGFVIKPRTGSMSKVEDLITSVKDPKLQSLGKAERSQYLIQEKLPLKEEFRVHMVNGVPFTATQRRIKNDTLRKIYQKITGSEGGGAFVPVTGKKRKEMMKFVGQAHEHLGETMGKGNHYHAAYDVAELKDGSFRLIEANPSPGTLRNPITARKLNRLVTGRWDKDVSAVGGLSVGAMAGLGAKKITDTYKDKD